MSRELNRVAIISGVRTPYVKSRESFNSLSTLDLGVIACREVIYRAELLPEEIDETLLSQGCFWPRIPQWSHGISTLAGVPSDRPSFVIGHSGASGLEAVATGWERILARRGQAILVSGAVGGDHYPLLFSKNFSSFLQSLGHRTSFLKKMVQMARFRWGYLKPRDILRNYTEKIYQIGERLAKNFAISREDQDRFALRSHRMAVQAYAKEKFPEEIVPVHIGPEFELCIEKDLHLRENLSIENLADSEPMEREDGTVTQQNASFLCDGASSLILASEEFAKSRKIEPLGYIRSYGFSGCQGPGEGLAGVLAARQALAKAEVILDEMDLVEIHEGTAASILAHQKAFSSAEFLEAYLGLSEPLGEVPSERLNVNGGAIALGHTLGSSGIRLLITLIMELKRQNLKSGLVVLSAGGTQGGAMVVEREN